MKKETNGNKRRKEKEWRKERKKERRQSFEAENQTIKTREKKKREKKF